MCIILFKSVTNTRIFLGEIASHQLHVYLSIVSSAMTLSFNLEMTPFLLYVLVQLFWFNYVDYLAISNELFNLEKTPFSRSSKCSGSTIMCSKLLKLQTMTFAEGEFAEKEENSPTLTSRSYF